VLPILPVGCDHLNPATRHLTIHPRILPQEEGEPEEGEQEEGETEGGELEDLK